VPVTSPLFTYAGGLGPLLSPPPLETPRAFRPRFIDFENMVGISGSSGRRRRRHHNSFGPMGLVQNLPVIPTTPASPGE